MDLIEQLKKFSEKEFESEDGDKYHLNLLPGMTQNELEDFKIKLPQQFLPKYIEELLCFTKGFDLPILGEINFYHYNLFGFEDAFPRSIQLAGDGAGNFWLVDIDSKGNWNAIFYVCHDPPVIVKQAKNIEEFIQQLEEYAENIPNSLFNKVQEELTIDIWNGKEDKLTAEKGLLIADLTEGRCPMGFNWGKFDSKTIISRPDDEPIWHIQKPPKQSFFNRLFRGKS